MPIKLVPPNPARRAPNYRVRGTYLGVRVDRSTETADRAKAQACLKRIENAIERGQFADKPPLGLAEAIVSYVRNGGEARFLKPILDHFGKAAVAAEIDQAAFDAAAVAIYPRAAPATRNRQFYTPLLAVLRHVGLDPKIRRPKGAAGQQRHVYLKPQQFEALAAAARAADPEFEILVTLLCYTGLRLSEALRIRCEDVSTEGGAAFCGKTKNGEPRLVYLPPRLAAAIGLHPRGLDRPGKLFRWSKCGELYLLAERVYFRAGVDPAGAPFHVLRHTFGKMMTSAGADLVATGAWKSASAARVYQHFELSEEARKADRIPGAISPYVAKRPA